MAHWSRALVTLSEDLPLAASTLIGHLTTTTTTKPSAPGNLTSSLALTDAWGYMYCLSVCVTLRETNSGFGGTHLYF